MGWFKSGYTEYTIVKNERNFFIIKCRGKGHRLNKQLRQEFLSYREAERHLIGFIARRDKYNRAVYPGSLKPRIEF